MKRKPDEYVEPSLVTLRDPPTFEEVVYDFYKTNGGNHGTGNDLPSLTRQEFAAECDINVIMEKYQKTGMLPANNAGREPMYVDFTSMPNNLMDTMRMFDDAQTAFMTLPAGVRREFENDPARFVDFAGDPANMDKLREWGLAAPKKAEEAPPPKPEPGAPGAGEKPAPGPKAKEEPAKTA